jgi:hypothetical protein
MNIKQLQAKVKAAQKANEIKIAEASKVASLEATLKLESSKTLFDSKVKLATSGYNTKVLKDLLTECEAIVESMPIQNPKTRTLRKWTASRRYIFGTQVSMLCQLATGILYSCAEHKEMLLSYTKLNLELLEQMVEAFGSPSYYSRNNNLLIEATSYDIDKAQSTVAVMQSSLNVIVDTSQLNANNFAVEFISAETVAYKDKLAADEAINEAELVP